MLIFIFDSLHLCISACTATSTFVFIRNVSAHSPEITDDYWISGGESINWLPFYIRLIWATLFIPL